MLFVLIFCTIGTLPSMPKSHLHDHFRLPFVSRLGALGVVHKNRTYIKLTRNTTQRNTSSTDNHVRRIATNAAIVHPILECSPTKSCSLSIATTLNVVKPSHHVLTILHTCCATHLYMQHSSSKTFMSCCTLYQCCRDHQNIGCSPTQVMQLIDRDNSECRDAFAPCAHHSTHLLCDIFIWATLLVDQHSTHLSHRDLHILCDCCTLLCVSTGD